MQASNPKPLQPFLGPSVPCRQTGAELAPPAPGPIFENVKWLGKMKFSAGRFAATGLSGFFYTQCHYHGLSFAESTHTTGNVR